MGTGLLEGAVFVEVAHPHTEYAGLLLAGLGAEVYLVEPHEGAITRRRRPFAPGVSSTRQSIPFLARNLGKKSLRLDPNEPESRRTFAALVEQADGILDCTGSPIHAEIERLAPATPRVTITDDHALGVSSIVAFAASGGLSSSGWPHQPPCNAPSWLALDGAGIYAAVMLLVAMRHGSAGARFQVPLQEAAVAAITPWTRPLHSYGMVVAGQGAASARLGAGPYPILPCKDGFVRVLAATPRQWQAWVELLDRPGALTTPEWEEPQFRAANFDVMVAVASEIVAERTVSDLFSNGQALGLTITPVMDIERFMTDVHVNARRLFEDLTDPEAGTVRVVRPVARYAPTDEPWRWKPAPSLGEHNDEAAALARAGREKLVAPRPPGGNPLAPLSGLRVLDCGVGAVVPEAASLLALLGAEVIKVESRKHIDFLRQNGLEGDHNSAPTFNQMNPGVLSLSVDMTTEGGCALVQRLVPHCDIVMENLRGPVMAKWGLDYGTVAALRPDIIYLSSQGLGDGPYGGYQTYGPNLQTFSGVTSLWAHPDDPFPVGSTLNHPDHVAGKQFLTAVLAALIRRDRTGLGCHLDCAQYEAAAALIGDRFLQHQLLPGSVVPLGNFSPDMAPHGSYPCLGEDAWCALAVETDDHWQRLAAVIAEDWAFEPGLATAEGRLAQGDRLDALISGWTQDRTASEVEQLLREARVPVSRVVTGDDLAMDESAHGDGLFSCVAHPTAGARWYTGLPVTGPAGERIPLRRAPLLGEHDGYVLFELLGLSAGEASALVNSGAIGY